MKYTKEYRLFDAQVNEALTRVKELQPFDNYYLWRAAEFKNLFTQVGIKFWGDVVEIGCGNGFNSALIATIGRKVISTDLECANPDTHSLGITRASKLIKTLGVKNCSVISAGAEELPFKDGSFDVVYSNYTLEHIGDKRAAVSEMVRVVKKNGIIIATVPNFIERLTYIPVYYTYMVKRALFHGWNIIKDCFWKSNNLGMEYAQSKQLFFNADMLYERHPNFPFPDIHGCYRSFSQELISSFYFSWLALFKKNRLKEVKSFNTIFIPWHILSIFNSLFPLWLYSRSLSFNQKFGSLSPLKFFGHNLCFVFIKE